MSIRIRKPTSKSGPGRLSIYRIEYQPAHTVTGVRIPGHMRDAYVGSLPRFADADNAAEVIAYREATRDQSAPAKLTETEVKVLQKFLVKDAGNFTQVWPAALVASVRAQVEHEFEHKRATDATNPVLRAIEANAAAAAYLAKLAGEFRGAGRPPRELWKSAFVPLQQSWTDAFQVAQSANIVTKRPRTSKTKGGE